MLKRHEGGSALPKAKERRSFIVGNVFAYRSAKVSELVEAEDPVVPVR